KPPHQIKNGAGCPRAGAGWAHGFSLGTAGVDCAGSFLNVSISDQGRPDSLFLSWDEPDGGALGYTLAIYTLEPDVLLQNGSAGPNATSFQFQGLVPGTGYSIEVTAALAFSRHGCVTGTLWLSGDAVCVVFGTGPAPVHNLSLSSDGSPSALRASWMDAPGQKDGYRLVLYHLNSQGAVRNESVPRAVSTFLFDGLLAGSEYALRIITLAGARQASTSTHQWTAPTTPAALTLQSLGSSTSLFASWSHAEGAAWLHLTLHNLLSHMMTRTVSAKRGLSIYTFQHLSPGTLYHLGVSAAAGPYWAAGPNATAWTYPLAPSGVTLTSKRHPLGLSAAWHRASGDRDQFLIHLYSKELLMQQNVSVGPDTQNFTFLGLLPGIQYSVEVTALAGPYRALAPSATAWTCEYGLRPVGMVSYSESVHAAIRGALAAASPLMPLSPAMINGGSTSALLVHWEAPAGQRDGYLVSVYEEGSLAAGRRVNVGKDSTNVSLAGLAPGSCYHVGISALAGPYSSDPQNVTGCTVPAAPANVSLTNSGSSSVLRAAWDEPPGGRDHYRVILYSLAPWGIETAQSLGPNAQNITWTHLAAGSRFTAQVTAVKGPYESSSVNVTQWTYPLAPPNVYLRNQGHSDRLSASWGAGAGERDGYTLTLYHAQAGTVAANASVRKDAHKFTFSGLAPGHKYLLEVASVAGPYRTFAGNISDWTTPLVPVNFSAMPGESRTVLAVSWGQAPSQQDYCQLWLRGPGNTLPQRQTLAGGQVQHFFRGLVPGRNYSVSLSCVAGPYWSSTGILVLRVSPFSAPDPVEDLQCQPDSKGFSLSWTFPAGDVETCELAAERLSGGSPQAEAWVIAPRSKTSLWGLEPDSSYRISVSAVGRNGLRSRAVTLVCNTSAEGRSPPDVPRVEPGSRVLISPDTFSEENGQIEYYAVIVTSNESLSRPTQETVSSTWYDHYYGQEDSYVAVLLPNPFHPDKRSTPQIWSVPVGTDECGQSREICNGKLKANTQYRFSIAAFTKYDLVDPSVSFTAFSGKAVPRAASAVDSLEIIPLRGGVFSPRQGHNFISCRNVHRPIPIQSFKQYYEAKTANANHGFFQDFEELKEVGKEQPKVEAELPANVSKNRYPHVLPYDHSRVRLSLLGEEPHSDYINANYIPGYASPQEFIVTQGPLKKTIEDFWRLVWEQSVCNIIMLTVGMENGRVLCDHYWPSELSLVSYGHIHVDLLSQSSADEWTMRTFKLWHVSEQLRGRHVTHLHYTAWPDHGIPESTASLMAFLDLARGHMQKAKGSGPTLVHCSAGVGRSGTFIALDRLLQQLKQEKVVDVFNTIYTMRMSRYSMIQTLVRPWAFSLRPCRQISRAGRDSCPIPLKSFLQHHAQKSAKSNAGFLREYEVGAPGAAPCWRSQTPAPPYVLGVKGALAAGPDTQVHTHTP
uniref:protein-tyrosine-phosphatase n=1 Tax=Chelonoidis abingdonii TaxID=106734 RepID=A0A8C0IUP4_CHEAB